MRSQQGSRSSAVRSAADAARCLGCVVMPMSAIMSALLTYFALVVNTKTRYHDGNSPAQSCRHPLRTRPRPYRESCLDAKARPWHPAYWGSGDGAKIGRLHEGEMP